MWWIVGIILVGLYLGSALAEAWFDVRQRPTEEMEWCHVHGAFRKKHCLPFLNTTICPMCYNAAWKKAENR